MLTPCCHYVHFSQMQTEVVAEYSEVEPLDITASLLLLRMTVEEVGQRPMALLGQLGEVRV